MSEWMRLGWFSPALIADADPSRPWTWLFVGITFATYLVIGWLSRVRETSGFYVAGQGVPAIANGAATAADWMSAASFISMAGLISFSGSDGAVYLMGWTGGYVLLALLLAPYLRKFGHYTVPDFIGARYYSEVARIVAAVCAIFVSITYVAGQMKGVGVVFSRFLEINLTGGVMIGMAIVAFFAVLGGMKGITWTQVVQYVVLIVAFVIPSVAISRLLTGYSLPQVGFVVGDVVDRLNESLLALGETAYTEPFSKFSQRNVFCITGGAYVWHGRPASRDRAILYGQECAGGPLFGRLGHLLYRLALHHGTSAGALRAIQPDCQFARRANRSVGGCRSPRGPYRSLRFLTKRPRPMPPGPLQNPRATVKPLSC